MTFGSILLRALDVAAELWLDARQTPKPPAVPNPWAYTSAPPRGCPKCKEIAYVPGQAVCNKCGTSL